MTTSAPFCWRLSLALDRVILRLEQRQPPARRDSYRKVKATLERAVPACKAGAR